MRLGVWLGSRQRWTVSALLEEVEEVGESILNTNVRMFTRMVKVISLMSYCTMLDIIALVDVWKK